MIPSTYTPARSLTNGITTNFTFSFKAERSDEILVTLIDADGQEEIQSSSLYSVDFSGTSGGSVNFLVAPVADRTCLIELTEALTQQTRFRDQGSFYPEIHERAFDKLTRISQVIMSKLDRALILPKSIAAPDPQIPIITEGILGIVSGKWAFLSSAPVTLASNLLTAVRGYGSDLVNYLAPFTGSVGRLLYLKLSDTVCPLDLGAAGDGVTDDTTAVTNAAASGRPVVLSGRTYLIAGAVVPANARIIGPGTLKLKALGTGVYTPILNVTGPNVVIDGVKFDGNRSNQFANAFADAFNTGPGGTGKSNRCAVFVNNNGGSTVYNLTVDNCEFTAMWGASIAVQDMVGLTVKNCYFHDNNFEAIYHYGTSAALRNSHNRVIGNRFHNIASGDGSVNADCCVFSYADDTIFMGNVSYNCERTQAKFQASNDVSITGNVCDTNTISPFAAWQLQSGGSRVVIANNTARNVCQGVHVENGAFTNILIEGNQISQGAVSTSNPDGIALIGVSSAIVRGNYLTNVNRHGVYLLDCSNVRVYGNTLEGNASSALSYSNGVLIQNSGTNSNITIEGNRISGFKSATAASTGAISTTLTGGSITNLVVRGNEVHTATDDYTSRAIYLLQGSGAINGLTIETNKCWGIVEAYATSGLRIWGNDALRLIGTGAMGNVRGQGNAAPTSGQFYVGDVWMNTAPASAGYIGWVCTVAGAPGTWKAFGLIA